MKVVVWPSLVGISICWSIMAFLFVSRFVGFLASLAWRASVRLQGNLTMTRRGTLWEGTTPASQDLALKQDLALNGAVRIAIV
jgi:hypothetical protein